MTASELATFVREVFPHIQFQAEIEGQPISWPVSARTVQALDAAVGLLLRCRDHMDPMRGPIHPDDLEVLLATLRLVVGEKRVPDA